MSAYKVWNCKIVVSADDELPDGFDSPPRMAAVNAVKEAGINVVGCFSGWGGEMDEFEAEIVDRDNK